jgi:hypothetical protein
MRPPPRTKPQADSFPNKESNQTISYQLIDAAIAVTNSTIENDNQHHRPPVIISDE